MDEHVALGADGHEQRHVHHLLHPLLAVGRGGKGVAAFRHCLPDLGWIRYQIS